MILRKKYAIILKLQICPYCHKTHSENILKNSPTKTESFRIKKSDNFHISAQNIDCGYSFRTDSARRF